MIARPLALLLAAVLALTACGSSDKHSSTSSPAPSPATTTSAAPSPPATAAKDAAGCVKVAQPSPKGAGHLSKPSLRLSAAKHYAVTLKTNCGTIVIDLDVRNAPKTASSFAALVKRGFYDDLTFHRIVPGFVIQGGDPEGTGQGGPGYQIVEAPPSSLKYTRGVVAMAKTGSDPPGTSGSQFFIASGPQAAQLPPEYALVGRVSGSLAAVDKIAAEPADPNGVPASPVVIEKATLTTP